MRTKFIVMESAAKMPSSCINGRSYRRIAVVKVDLDAPPPKQINSSHKSILEIVEIWDKRYSGKTEKCAAAIARKEAEALAKQLNAE